MAAQKRQAVVEHSIRRHFRIGFFLLACLILGLGGWTALTELSAAAIATGRVVVESSRKAVQHVEGGLVKRLYVREGMAVATGDLLISLDATALRAKLAITERQAVELIANNLRLAAQRDDQPMPEAFDRDPVTGLRIPAEIMEAQHTLHRAQTQSYRGQIDQLLQRIEQNHELIKGLEIERRAKREESDIQKAQLARLQTLLKQKLVAEEALVEVRSDLAGSRGALGKLTSEIARTRGLISELRYQVHERKEQTLSKIITELNDNKAKLSQQLESRTEILDNLKKLDIRAPVAGVVHQLSVHTEGGVLSAGAVAMYIVPDNDRLIVEVELSPDDINEIWPGQTARLVVSAFDQNEVPELIGVVETIAADIVEDPQTGQSHFPLRIRIEPEEIAKLGNERLQPGMPVQAFVEKRSRTVLAYLLEPLSDHIARTFRE